MSTAKSPYLSSSNRLADVIAALQATATYKFYQLSVQGDRGWAWRIAGDPSKAEEFQKVFREHPEFFRIDDKGKGSLVLRRQHQKLFDVDRGVEIPRNDYASLTRDEKQRVSRTPLEPAEVATLINTAIELHARAIEQERAKRWWITPVVSLYRHLGVL